MLQTIKDVNQSLVDDNLVESDKIGAGAFFWALPSKGFQQRQNLIGNVKQKTEEVKAQCAEVSQKIEEARAVRTQDGGDRDKWLKEIEELKKANAELKGKVRMFGECDPKRMDDINTKAKVCKDGMVRWTDNLYEVENWIKRNNPAITSEELYQNFPLLRDLDYCE